MTQSVPAIRVDRDVSIPMRDGIVLKGDIYRPDDGQTHPAVLIRTPYDKRLNADTDFFKSVDAAFAGYAVMVQDVRGRYASDGDWDLGAPDSVEGIDGYDTIEWIAGQSWSNGSVAMAGVSYLARLQWQAAMQNPPHLRAIAPAMIGCGSWPLDEQSRISGTSLLHLWIPWIPHMGLDVAARLARAGTDVSEVTSMLTRALLNTEAEGIYSHAPQTDIPHFQFEKIIEIWDEVRTQISSDPAREDDVHWDYDKVRVPCLHIGGWYDIYTYGTFLNFHKMREIGGSRLAQDSQHILMGPWVHSAQLPHFSGDTSYGILAGGAGAGLTQQTLAFFDRYMDDAGTSSEIPLPPVRYFVMGRNSWQESDSWPPAQTQRQRFYLHSRGNANTAAGDGALSTEAPLSETPDHFRYDPDDPVPTVGGRVVTGVEVVGGPIDQYYIEQRRDILCYTSAELEQALEVSGPLEFHLWAATTATDTDFTAKLIDVHPDGHAYPIADGILRARYRESFVRPRLIEPGTAHEYVINMGHTSHCFRAGHRLRIDVSSSNFPGWDRNMNTGNDPGTDTNGIVAEQTILHEAKLASYIDLPVVRSADLA